MIDHILVSGCCLLALTLSVNAGPLECPEGQRIVATTAVIAQSPGRYRQAFERQIPKGAFPDVLIIGDSIALGWYKYQRRDFPNVRVHNFGVGGEPTQELVWRLRNFASGEGSPSEVVLVIGTNNLTNSDFSACGITLGVSAVVEEIRGRWPNSHVYVVPILPRGEKFRFRESERRKINAALSSSFEGHPTVHVVSIDETNLTCRASATCSNYQPDRLHLTAEGYGVLRKALSNAGMGRTSDEAPVR